MEFAQIDELRAERIGSPLMKRLYGIGVPAYTGKPPSCPRESRLCPACNHVKEWAGDSKKCPTCRSAALGKGHRDDVSVTPDELEALRGDMNRNELSRAIGAYGSWYRDTLRRAKRDGSVKMRKARYDALVVVVGK